MVRTFRKSFPVQLWLAYQSQTAKPLEYEGGWMVQLCRSVLSLSGRGPHLSRCWIENYIHHSGRCNHYGAFYLYDECSMNPHDPRGLGTLDRCEDMAEEKMYSG